MAEPIDLKQNQYATDEQIQEIVEKYDPESRFRKTVGLASKAILIFCMILSLFHMYTAGFGVLQEWKHRSFHLSFVMLLIFLCYPIKKKELPRLKSFIYSGLYALIGGGIISFELMTTLHIPLIYFWLIYLFLASSLFYFKERPVFSLKIVPWVDLFLSGVCLTAMGVFIVFILNHWPEVIGASRIRVAIWLWAIVGIITAVFLVQASLVLYAIIKRGEGFRIDPLKIPYFDIVLATMAFGISSYIFLDFDQFILRAGHINLRDLMIGLIAIPLILEGTRRSIGVPLMVIALFALAYCYLGPYLVGVPLISDFAHRGYSVKRIIDHMYSGTEGIYGIPVGVVATYVFHFVLFGLFIAKTGLGQLFIDISMALAGGSPGGPAKVAIVASCFCGTVSGSSIANTVGTGSFTIPMMKRIGLSSEFAGAVEAAASTGGQIMPPIMGAAAFIMAQYLGIPYVKICLAAMLPAVLHFYGIGVMIHFQALKKGLLGLPKDQLPKMRVIMKERGIMLIPMILILWLLIDGRSPFLAAFWAMITAMSFGQMSSMNSRTITFIVPIILSLPGIVFDFNIFHANPIFVAVFCVLMLCLMVWTFREAKLRDWLVGLVPTAVMFVLSALRFDHFTVSFWTNIAVIALGVFYRESNMRVRQIVECLEGGTKNALAIGAACAAVGLIVGTSMLTGLGLKFGQLTISLARQIAEFLGTAGFHYLFAADAMTLFFLLILTAIACFILGMGLPTTAQYIVAVIIAAPALLEFGIHPFLSHMFVFFYAILADITPPVALAAYAASGISGGDPFRTGLIAFSNSASTWILPMVWMYAPIVVMMPWLLDPKIAFDWMQFGYLYACIVIGLTILGASFRGYFAAVSTIPERILGFIAALMLFSQHSVPVSVSAAAIVVAIFLIQKLRTKKALLAVQS
ncbi:MAG: TRAP transporter fused permease subunit [Deltaproteobacteria bacterium]|nr:TRAP transporter fused permease subunit [Deltaproteobacteria bacterium]